MKTKLATCLLSLTEGLQFATVPGPPINLMAVPSTSACNEVLFNWNLPPEDERNGITRFPQHYYNQSSP